MRQPAKCDIVALDKGVTHNSYVDPAPWGEKPAITALLRKRKGDRKPPSAKMKAMVGVIAKGGKPLMPTNIKRARKLLRAGRAEIADHHPFAIRLLDWEDGELQPVEYKCDTGDRHIGSRFAQRNRR